MRQHTAVIALFLFGGVFVLGLLALASVLGPGVSQADDATMHNCPQASKWAIAVWDGDDGTDAEQAFATCGAVPVAAAYYIDPDKQVWSRYFMGRAEISNLSPLSGKQGLLTLGATGVAPATPTVAASPAASPTPSATPTPVPTPTPDIEELTALGLYLEWGFGVLHDLSDLMARADVAMDDWWDALPGSNAEQDTVNRLYAVASEADSLYRDALLVLPPEGWEGYHVDFVILLDKSAELFTLIAEGMDEYDFDKLWLAVDVKEDVSDQIDILGARLDQAASMQASSFDAQEGSLHNCPRPEKWAIASWDGPDATEISEAVGTCGQAAVAAAYYIDPEMSVWLRWFDGRPEVSNLTTLDKWQGILALGGAEAPVTPTPTLSPSPTPTTVATPSPTPTPVTQSFSGQGYRAISPIQLDEGLTIVTLTHTGSSNFAIWLLDSDGEHVDLLVNEIGSFDGSTALRIEVAGAYALDITADGAWTIKIEQLQPTSAPGVPRTFTGTGPKASALFWLDKTLTTFQMSHDGSSNFAIWLLDSDGEHVDLLVNEIGSFDGSTAIGVPAAGVYILDITADGHWTISVQQ